MKKMQIKKVYFIIIKGWVTVLHIEHKNIIVPRNKLNPKIKQKTKVNN